MKKILVTGGAGYIGSHTVVELYNHGYEAIIMDNFSNSDPGVIKAIEEIVDSKINFINVDVSEEALFIEEFDKISHDISGVIHFAAFKSVPESVKEPQKYYDNNIKSMTNVIFAAKSINVPIIFSSSCSVYGNADTPKVTEDTPLKPAQSPYADTKQMCEYILKLACSTYKFKGISLRYFNPIGAHSSGLIGENPIKNIDNLIPRLCKMALDRDEVTVFGLDYPTHDGSCIRDYIYIMDLANAHVKALEYAFDMTQVYDVFNVGTGMGTSVLELLKTFELATDVPLIIRKCDRREGDVIEIYSDTTKINNVLGWESKYDLLFSLESAWNWALKLYRHKVKNDIY